MPDIGMTEVKVFEIEVPAVKILTSASGETIIHIAANTVAVAMCEDGSLKLLMIGAEFKDFAEAVAKAYAVRGV